MDKDTLRPFIIENTDIRGEWVHLDESWQELLGASKYPAAVRQVLGEAAAAVCLLAATIKFDGSLILQINGTGPVNMLVIQATSDGHIRGLAQIDEQAEGQQLESRIPDLFGQGQIVISIVTDKENERYQGIIVLQGDTLAHCLDDYFKQSEQIPTRVYLTSDDNSAAGLLIQQLPGKETADQPILSEPDDERSESWAKASSLTNTLTSEELLTLDINTLLHRLFHEDDLRLFDGSKISYQCSCSREKIENTIRSLGKAEVTEIIDEQEKIEIHCDFCNTLYSLDVIDIEGIFNQQISQGPRSLQ
jgi:molecular chaperone Hsp33